VALGLLKNIPRPSPPGLGHPGNRKQPLDFSVITGVDAKHIADGQIVIGFLDYPDRISGPHITLHDDSEVSPGAQGLGETARERLIIHPNSKPPAWNSRLGNLKNHAPELPTLADERVVHLNPFCREILAKLTVGKRPADLLFPPARVFDGVGVDGFIGSPVRLAIRLVVSGKIHTSGCDPTEDR
jgi:hypothetical protein